VCSPVLRGSRSRSLPGGLAVADDSRVPALPRRVPGDKRRPGTGPVARLVLSEADIQRIRDALDAVGGQASPQNDAAPVERPSSLPRRVPKTSGHGPPAAAPAPAAQPVQSPFLPPSLSAESLTEPQGIPAARASEVTEEIKPRPDVTAPPEPATAVPADPTLVPAQDPPGEQQPGQQDRRDEETASPEQVPGHPENGRASQGKARARRTKARTRPPKPSMALATLAKPSPLRKRGRRSPGVNVGVVVVTALLSAGSLAFVLTRHAGAVAPDNGFRTRVSVEVRAAAWVAEQVSRAAKVSCDQAMCQALEERGVPAASLHELKAGQADRLRSGVLVSTAAVRTLMGTEAVAADAPAVIARFGSGSVRIEIREIVPGGAAVYFSSLTKDIRDRRASGISLLENPRIKMSATARGQLRAGQVDSRLLVVIADLAAGQQVSILGFGDLGPGASPGIPFRCVYLAETEGTAVAQVQRMSAFLRGQTGPYAAAHIQPGRLAGRSVLLIEFSAPSPQGLLGPGAP
jgi:hypothetical protein